MGADAGAVLGTIGRKRISFALAAEGGGVQPETIRCYNSEAVGGVTAALIAFQRDLNLPQLPRRSAIAIPGLVRGDAIAITNTRWVVSRSGLHAMLGAPPLILNDFAAEAWALSSNAGVRLKDAFHGAPSEALRQPGCYLVIGITSGLGVAAVHRAQSGAVTVIPTEAGHATFAAATEELAGLTAEMFPGRRAVAVEEVISAPGLLAIYHLLVKRSRSSPRAKTPEAVTGSATTDPVARAACDVLARAFWAYAGNLVTTFGAWDGVFVTGAAGSAIAHSLRSAEAQAMFATSIKHRRVLQSVPRGLVYLEHAELHGLAAALLHEAPLREAGSLYGQQVGSTLAGAAA